MLHVPVAMSSLPNQGFSIEVCRNGACIRGQFDLPDAGLGVYDGTTHSFPERARSMQTDRIDVTLELLGEPNARLDIDYFVPDTNQLRDGDRYTVAIHDADGQLLVSADKLVTYTTDYPNGPGCDPGCKRAELTVVAAGH